jgi:hypothetical protein
VPYHLATPHNQFYVKTAKVIIFLSSLSKFRSELGGT